jgi:aryl-alcohol dehydrogenase-like predicted oxidoreductase
LQHALDAGVTFFDTAAIYGQGTNEKLVAKALMHRRKEFVLASKCVLDVRDGQRVLNGHPDAMTRTLEEALVRLNTDHIDLYYMHRLDKTVPIEDSIGALVRAKEAGKIGAIGLSEMSAVTLRRAHAVHPIAAMQSEYSPWVRNPEVAVLAACRELGVGFVAFSPVARGFLAGGVRDSAYGAGDIRTLMPRFQEPNLSHNLMLFARFEQLAKGAGLTPAQLAMGWVLSRSETLVPIPGTRSIAHLDEDLSAAHLKIDPSVLAEVETIFAPNAVAGPRYSPAMQAQIDTELLPEEG